MLGKEAYGQRSGVQRHRHWGAEQTSSTSRGPRSELKLTAGKPFFPSQHCFPASWSCLMPEPVWFPERCPSLLSLSRRLS